jgi:hypothetical protein
MKNTRRDFIIKSAMGTGLLAGGLSSCQPGSEGSGQVLNDRFINTTTLRCSECQSFTTECFEM